MKWLKMPLVLRTNARSPTHLLLPWQVWQRSTWPVGTIQCLWRSSISDLCSGTGWHGNRCPFADSLTVVTLGRGAEQAAGKDSLPNSHERLSRDYGTTPKTILHSSGTTLPHPVWRKGLPIPAKSRRQDCTGCCSSVGLCAWPMVSAPALAQLGHLSRSSNPVWAIPK